MKTTSPSSPHFVQKRSSRGSSILRKRPSRPGMTIPRSFQIRTPRMPSWRLAPALGRALRRRSALTRSKSFFVNLATLTKRAGEYFFSSSIQPGRMPSVRPVIQIDGHVDASLVHHVDLGPDGVRVGVFPSGEWALISGRRSCTAYGRLLRPGLRSDAKEHPAQDGRQDRSISAWFV